MPRTRNTRPTTIYWLVDVRPEILVQWPRGYPFYCGKTVLRPQYRFDRHRRDSFKFPDRPLSKRLRECDEFVSVRTMETVPADADWIEREKFWIYTLRLLWTGALNIADGGQGVPGYVASVEVRAKQSAALTGRVISKETRARIGKATASRDPSVYRKISLSNKGRIVSAETRSKLSAAGKGKKRSAETRARMSLAQKGLRKPPISEETRAKMRASRKKQVMSSEWCAKISKALKGRPRSKLHVERWRASLQARRLRATVEQNG